MNADEITGERVHIHMRRNGIKQETVAAELGLTQTSLSRKLLGKRSWTLDEILAVAYMMDEPVSAFLPGTDYAPVLSGRGRSGEDVRPKRLELPTFWMGAREWSVEDEALYRAEVVACSLPIHTNGSIDA